MRIVIDLQGAQTESAFRGIGRYSLALALSIAKNALDRHEIWLVLNGAFSARAVDIRKAFKDLVPQNRIKIFHTHLNVAEWGGNKSKAMIAEKVREHLIESLKPDMVLVTSLFEGYVDNAVTSINSRLGSKTAVIFYDLIPFLNSEVYLPSTSQKDHYYRKIESLQNAGLLLSISNFSRQIAIEKLNFPKDLVCNISSAIDSLFHPVQLNASQKEDLVKSYNISQKFIFYAPGGFDGRKNVTNLIKAYRLLPENIQNEYQLVIGSKVPEKEQSDLEKLSRGLDLKKGRVVFTGYINNEDLVKIYSVADLVVYPSLYEGFGLPPLEAMACGAPVIGSNNTSIPEVIGLDEALFDPNYPKSIAEKMEEVLLDKEFSEYLRKHGIKQAEKFSWDISGKAALEAIEHCHEKREKGFQLKKAISIPIAPKKRLAFISPLPPQKTGIAFYSAELLEKLSHFFEIDLIVRETKLSTEFSSFRRRSVDWFEEHGAIYDRVIYQMGNSPFHTHMLDLLKKYPGVVVLHDLFLSSLLAYEEILGGMPGIWLKALFDSHGYYPAILRIKAENQAEIEQVKQSYPCNMEVIQNAKGIIVHSKHAKQLADQYYGEGFSKDWCEIPLLRLPPKKLNQGKGLSRSKKTHNPSIRKKLGIDKNAFVVVSFGMVASTKLNHRLLEAWFASKLHLDSECLLIFVGELDGGAYGKQVTQLILKNHNLKGSQNKVRVTGWVDQEQYEQYLLAADAGVQLRALSKGETSAAVLDCMNYGLPTIVNESGSMAELPAGSVRMLPEDFTDSELTEALEAFHSDVYLRKQLGSSASHYIKKHHAPFVCAKKYYTEIEAIYEKSDCDQSNLIQEILNLEIDFSDRLLKNAARSIAATFQPKHSQKQLLIDISSIVQNNLKTGIERLIQMQLVELLKKPSLGVRVEPVYLVNENGSWVYKYARNYVFQEYTACQQPDLPDVPVDVYSGDVFYSASYLPYEVILASKQGLFSYWKMIGVEINTLVYDLLPIRAPQFFPLGAEQTHASWLHEVAKFSDRLIGISASIADEISAWLKAQNLDGVLGDLEVTSVLCGADGVKQGSFDSEENQSIISIIPEGFSGFLMVGTIEPRKGHLQVLDAFEQLWNEGSQESLVIIGKEGWKGLPDDQRRTIPEILNRLKNHPENGRKLFWLEGISDRELEALYAQSKCFLMASEGEGFGLPLVEAARHKVPIIARDIPIFKEVTQGHAHFFSGLEGQELAQSIKNWLTLHEENKAPDSSLMVWNSWKDNVSQLKAILLNNQEEDLLSSASLLDIEEEYAS